MGLSRSDTTKDISGVSRDEYLLPFSNPRLEEADWKPGTVTSLNPVKAVIH